MASCQLEEGGDQLLDRPGQVAVSLSIVTSEPMAFEQAPVLDVLPGEPLRGRELVVLALDRFADAGQALDEQLTERRVVRS